MRVRGCEVVLCCVRMVPQQELTCMQVAISPMSCAAAERVVSTGEGGSRKMMLRPLRHSVSRRSTSSDDRHHGDPAAYFQDSHQGWCGSAKQ